MPNDEFLARQMGDQPPLLAGGRKPPDKREISLRWLSGTFMTGITSSLLMGVALFGALEGREQLAIPAEAMAAADLDSGGSGSVEKGSRLIQSVVTAKPVDRAIMEVSTMVRDGDHDVVRRQPFAHVKIALAANHHATASKSYPRFDPLKIFSAGEAEAASSVRTGVIYGADVESEISLRSLDFPVESPERPFAASMTLDEAEETVRTNGSVLTDGSVQLASLNYVDPRRFVSNRIDLDFSASLNARVIAENVSVASYSPSSPERVDYVDDIIPVRKAAALSDILDGAGYGSEQYEAAMTLLAQQIKIDKIPENSVIRIGVEQSGERARIIRMTLYQNSSHVITVALSDHKGFVIGNEPPHTPAIRSAFDETATPIVTARDLPNIYDGIYRAGLTYGMSTDMVEQIIKMLASNVDFQSPLRPSDTLEAFFSVTDESGAATEESELLFVNAKFGGNAIRLYRFQHPEDNSIDYYDEEGRSARQFLLRNPVPNGKFRSGFGMRRHPILKYSRMHTGVDWSAPRGTPIIAAGNGVVEKASWDKGGYGRQTIIRHANGYESSYSHQHTIAKGVVPGARIRQGQVIGTVGSTGLSTGPHLHYELIVNGNKVDPMRIRLPDGKSLKDDAYAMFARERDRINALLGIEIANKELASR
ncbi:MAG: M23 family metallopeptidase [Hoeflea sp.]|uniref:M23 family metallopeptidase n=1 Tax=Hoeflea sp. TaxID=1940281 RepID=UPI001D7B64BC|nr:M23 family metallopeptidase [Hoeflea sp.]MBU4528700.1 M23 family metallopeptidase [Alphaproteobacteria bacterium]MBU4545495.1 M23 family metallopeptidase [Alphaproteobacteria bacterium]MBU4552105.1 M23 family metallopeptidase [Alphaproteobacteria bacterium]MBV1726303.1 M23 family metallopeptidase [Hoeflea sp.]MBV1762270.1 M23 family metallopeptidase [Hoeflea sp.]